MDDLARRVASTEVRRPARSHVDFVVFTLRDVIRKLTGRGGRTVDRVTGGEKGLLFEFAFEAMAALSPVTPEVELASRVRSALRKPRALRMRKQSGA